MDKTRFSNVCRVLSQLWLFYRDEAENHQEWANFFDWADIGLPLANAVDSGYVTGVKKEGKDIIAETWKVFCEMIALDPDGDYYDIFAAFGASPMPPLNSKE